MALISSIQPGSITSVGDFTRALRLVLEDSFSDVGELKKSESDSIICFFTNDGISPPDFVITITEFDANQRESADSQPDPVDSGLIMATPEGGWATLRHADPYVLGETEVSERYLLQLATQIGIHKAILELITYQENLRYEEAPAR